MLKFFKKEPRCKHRHTIRTHPHCFNEKGLPVESARIGRLPKVLVFDIETAPLKAFVFQKSVWGGNIGDEQVISEWFTLCWSAKWLLDDKIMSSRLTGKEAVNEDDARIVEKLWKLLDEADIVIAHNASGFDVPNMNTRLLVNGLPPTTPYQIIDTKTVAKRQFGFTHNSLNALARVFGFEVKMDTDFDLWKRCTNGDEKALAYMEEYNRYDVQLLEDVYMKLRPWIRSHPNLGLYVESNDTVCPNCGNDNVTWLDKYYYAQAGKYQLFRCECGAFGRSRTNAVPNEIRKALGVSVAR